MAATTKTYTVVDGTQVHHDGKTLSGGETVTFTADHDPALIAYMVNAGWITKKPSRKASSS